MGSLYSLLYLPLVGLTALWLLAGLKLIKNYRKHSREELRRIAGAVVALALVDAGVAVMLISHGHSYRAALILNMAAGGVNLLRTRGLFQIRTWIVGQLHPAGDS